MKHQHTIESYQLTQGLKSCLMYMGKNKSHFNYGIISLPPESKKLTFIACDKFGLCVSRHTLIDLKDTSNEDLSGDGFNLIINRNNIKSLYNAVRKFKDSLLIFEFDDEQIVDGKYIVNFNIHSEIENITMNFLVETNIEPYDYQNILDKTKKKKKSNQMLSNITINSNQLIRVAKLIPKKDFFIDMFFTNESDGHLITIEPRGFKYSEDFDSTFVFKGYTIRDDED